MGNCSQRAVSDGGGSSVKVVERGSTNIVEEYYRSCSCSSLAPIKREETLRCLVKQGTLSPRRVGPKIQVSPQRRNRVWKAKVLIGSKQLEDILADDGNTHALIDQLRIAAAEASASEIVGGRNLSSRKSKESYFC
ncbi:unnamed protein product [Eruca vesicaria subsp. sativa]|uniref:Uncharacterized protein n=1 Tax=Eruca vesicaria subsp. sativa TaxID=29727 RepID=A0ABC8KL53_ERUVS|nr:unnamed protein product [Eruca vesicaria subsp. sativa]